MLGDEARELLGFPPNSTPSSSQVKAAYKKKAWETHPDRFPNSQKSLAESNFKLIAEAYACLQSDTYSTRGTYSRVVRTGVPRSQGGSKNKALIQIPFLLIVVGTVALVDPVPLGLTKGRKRHTRHITLFFLEVTKICGKSRAVVM